ncbi:ABC transporter ATP-binding protein [Paenibacillus rigui]|uniref:ABC transporter n=1 Tax=Paenibacillus rigui TaxID=554312 RepID=A0A229UNH6_9BACL|nr:ABC transporter ATP-binding protein [Paenibacillus rigui]OXM84845.1 ABC transporter [Paenibacillus rigui]
MGLIELKQVNKHFDGNPILRNLSLHIEEGDFMTFLGPSGCGKTTTLRMIAGLEHPESGTIVIDGKLADDGRAAFHKASSERGLSLVFQSYALWPHMSVFDNVAFGLTMKKLPKPAIRAKVEEALEKMRILDLTDRYPSELSGGQQQRVAIARAIVTEPRILLLDEPLSNLDAKLRMEMRAELKRLHRELKTTIIYVTHDQVEALTLSTKIAVFFQGELVQVDTPSELYRNPATLQVADFIGNPSINFVEAFPVGAPKDGRLMTQSGLGRLDVSCESPPERGLTLAVKPEDITVRTAPEEKAIACTVYSVFPAGSETLLQLTAGNLLLMAKLLGQVELDTDSQVWITVPTEKINVYDAATGRLLSRYGKPAVEAGRIPAAAVQVQEAGTGAGPGHGHAPEADAPEAKPKEPAYLGR